MKVAQLNITELYARFKGLVLSISSEIAVKPMKQYIAFRTKTNITDIVVLLDDPKRLARDISEVGHWGNGDYQNFTDTSII